MFETILKNAGFSKPFDREAELSVVIFLHNDSHLASQECDLGKTKIIVAKNASGDIGKFNLTFNLEKCRLEE